MKLAFYISSFLFIGSIFSLEISPEQAEKIAEKIWYHESAHQVERSDLLTFWNKVEPFPSLGIGHFIWPPKSYNGVFASGKFHEVITFLKAQGANVPKWLEEAKHCPWETREAFYEDFESDKMEELRELLLATKPLQALYMCQSLEVFQTKLEKDSKASLIFETLSESGTGIYMLIDYLNFKGAGSDPNRNYQGFGWGLLNVFENVQLDFFEKDPISSFRIAAKYTLMRRILHAKDPIAEEKWIQNWFERLDSYRED